MLSSDLSSLASREAGSLPKPQVLGRTRFKRLEYDAHVCTFVDTLRADQLLCISGEYTTGYVVWYRELLCVTL